MKEQKGEEYFKLQKAVMKSDQRHASWKHVRMPSGLTTFRAPGVNILVLCNLTAHDYDQNWVLYG